MEYETETSKILLENKVLSLIKPENKLLSLLQDYEIKSVFERLQDYVCLSGRVIRLQKRGRITRVFLREREGYLLSTLVKFLDLKFGPVFCFRSLSFYR